ncbi:MAG: hypothetical protein AB7V46_16820 [Thermomicrobiales bacterium]
MTAIALTIRDPQQEVEQWCLQEAAKYVPKLVPAEMREAYARGTSLRQFYKDCLRGRWERFGKEDRKRSTYAKDRQALNRWERYTRPDEWRGEWEGPPLGFLDIVSDDWLETQFDKMEADPSLSKATVDATRSHLLHIMRHAVKVQAISRHPGRKRPKAIPKTRIYTPGEVSAILDMFAVEPLLHAAFWLMLHVGPRTEDLFLMKWSNVIEDVRGRRLLDYEAMKTGKLQAVPIADCVWDVLETLDKSDTYLFPDMSNPNVLDPEKSVEAKVRNKLAKRLMKRAGVDVPNKPWQVARATCNERFEAHKAGVGQFVLGHSLQGVNATSYREPTEAVWQAVKTLPPYTHGVQRRLF